jgi:UDP-2,3-diacylglucosamine hydrolase
MTLLPEEQVLDLYGRKVLIMHGDTLCTDDTGYLAFRAKVHTRGSSAVPCPAAVYPPPHRRQNARGSKAANSSKSMEIMDVNPQAVVRDGKHQVQWLIHGHTHRPDVHELIANGKPATAWYRRLAHRRFDGQSHRRRRRADRFSVLTA